MNNVITYSPSRTIALTHACANRCLYCGFREDGDGLYPFEEIRKVTGQKQGEGTPEMLLMSGEHAEVAPSVRNDLISLGFTSMVQWTRRVADYLLDRNLLPHINIGTLDFSSFLELKEVSASIGLMMEGDYGSLGETVHPQKNFVQRLQNLEWAGQLHIPFTTGILVGIGESQKDRIRSIKAITECGKTYGHLQEIILQKYVPNHRSRVQPQEITAEELRELIITAREELPDISMQIPPNLNSNWADLLELGFNDIGGISNEADVINSENPWPAINEITETLKQRGYQLRKRLPIYRKYYKMGWYSNKVKRIIEEWIQSDEEYDYYTQ